MNERRFALRLASRAGSAGLLAFGALNLIAGIYLAIEFSRDWAREGVVGIVGPMCLVGVVAVLAAKDRLGQGERPSYWVSGALLIQVLSLSSAGVLFGLPLLLLHFGILLSLALRFRSSFTARILLMSYTLAALSALIYQRTGPAIGVYGNMCGDPPNHLCSGPVLGAGFPVQYIVDVPTISVPGRLSLEDDLRGASLAVDILFYCVALLTGRKLVQIVHTRKGRLSGRHEYAPNPLCISPIVGVDQLRIVWKASWS